MLLDTIQKVDPKKRMNLVVMCNCLISNTLYMCSGELKLSVGKKFVYHECILNLSLKENLCIEKINCCIVSLVHTENNALIFPCTFLCMQKGFLMNWIAAVCKYVPGADSLVVKAVCSCPSDCEFNSQQVQVHLS